MRALISFAMVAVAVVCQLTIVDRIAFPGGAGPDLVLVLVAALALASGPLVGALTGFWAGLALDVAPPGSHFTGQNALVFCLVGYFCGLLADAPSSDGTTEPGHTALFEIVVTAAGAICGEALAALLGVMLSDPRVTWPAITHVLPVAAIYDAVACPFVLYAAAAALRLAGPLSPLRPARARGEARTVPSGAGSGAIRPVGTRSAPRLRLSGGPGENWIGRSHGPGAGGRPAARREPRFKLGHGWPAGGGLGTAFAASGSLSGPVKVRFAGRRREGVLGGSLRGGAVGGPLYGGNLGSSGLASTRMGRSLLGDSVFSRPSPALARTVSPGRATPLGRSLAPRFSRGKALGRLTGTLRRPARPRSPGRGWLRGASPRSGALGGRPSSSSALKGSAAFKGSAFKGGSFKSRSIKGSAFKGSAFRSGTSLGRGSGAEAWRRGTPRLRSGGATRLRLPRRKRGRDR